MRYWKDESTYILSIFDTWLNITIDIYDLLDNTKIIDNIACSEVWTTWVYKYQFSKTITSKSEFVWIMKSSNDNHYWKIVLWGVFDDRFLDTDRTTLNNITWMSEAELHTWLDNYANKDDYKADVSNIPTETLTTEEHNSIINWEAWAKKAWSQRFY